VVQVEDAPSAGAVALRLGETVAKPLQLSRVMVFGAGAEPAPLEGKLPLGVERFLGELP